MYEYASYTDVSGLFIGIGVMVLLFVLAYFAYIFCKLYKGLVENALHYSVLEDVLLQRVAKKKGIDIEKEMVRREFMPSIKRSFRKRIKDEIYNEFFNQEEKKE